MANLSGFVENIVEREVTFVDKFNPGQMKTSKAYDITVNDIKYGGGFKKPTVKEGDYVEFSAKQNGEYWNLVAGTMEVAPVPEGERDKAPATERTSKPAGAVTESSRDASIKYQSCLERAILFVDMVARNGGFKLTAKNHADNFQIMAEAVDFTAARFYRDVTAVQEAGTVDVLSEQDDSINEFDDAPESEGA